MNTKATDEKLGKLHKFEAGLLSKHYAEVLETCEEIKGFLSKSRDSIFINAIFLKLADILECTAHPTRMLIVKVSQSILTLALL